MNILKHNLHSFVYFGLFLTLVNASGRNTNQQQNLVASSESCPNELLVTRTPTMDGDDYLSIMASRRIDTILGTVDSVADIPNWLSSLGPDGKWPDDEVDYATQCEARRANWPAQEHWRRILNMAGAYHGGAVGGEEWVGNSGLRDALGLALNWWFERDFLNDDCQDAAGTQYCPCTDPPTPAQWMLNTNWFSNIILIPRFVGRVCLLLNSTLTDTERGNCTHMTARSFGNFERDSPVRPVGWLTGANTLDVAAVGIDGALVSHNIEQLSDAYGRIHEELSIKEEVTADGIRPDGAFGQHGGLIYNGNYGKDYLRAILDLELASAGTPYEADDIAKQALETLLEGDRWMIYRNTLTDVLHWDFSVLPRFISFPVADLQATGDIRTNLTAVDALGNSWGSHTLIDFASSLSAPSSSNAGNRIGNRMFYTNDYMANRGTNYVSTLRMYSSRSKSTECINSQNPLGFHLSDGTLYTYVSGNEYEDIAASWDWNMIPGTTTDYGATPLSCEQAEFFGFENMVGGASDGNIGVAAMRYTNPLTRAFSFQKAWFFLEDDVQHVVVTDISSTTSAPVISVLDQKRHSGQIFVKSGRGNVSLWHADVGYVVKDPTGSLRLQHAVEEKTGDWSLIGISEQPPTTVDLFKAYVEHTSLDVPLEYTAYPGVGLQEFLRKSRPSPIVTVQANSSATAIYDRQHSTSMVVFWSAEGGSVEYRSQHLGNPFTISTTKASAVIFNQQTGDVTISDPTQTVDSISVTLDMPGGSFVSKTLYFKMPTGGDRGKSVTQNIYTP